MIFLSECKTVGNKKNIKVLDDLISKLDPQKQIKILPPPKNQSSLNEIDKLILQLENLEQKDKKSKNIIMDQKEDKKIQKIDQLELLKSKEKEFNFFYQYMEFYSGLENKPLNKIEKINLDKMEQLTTEYEVNNYNFENIKLLYSYATGLRLNGTRLGLSGALNNLNAILHTNDKYTNDPKHNDFRNNFCYKSHYHDYGYCQGYAFIFAYHYLKKIANQLYNSFDDFLVPTSSKMIFSLSGCNPVKKYGDLIKEKDMLNFKNLFNQIILYHGAYQLKICPRENYIKLPNMLEYLVNTFNKDSKILNKNNQKKIQILKKSKYVKYNLSYKKENETKKKIKNNIIKNIEQKKMFLIQYSQEEPNLTKSYFDHWLSIVKLNNDEYILFDLNTNTNYYIDPYKDEATLINNIYDRINPMMAFGSLCNYVYLIWALFDIN